MTHALWYTLAAAPVMMAISSPAAAVDYLSVADAQRVLIPGATRFEAVTVSLTRAQLSAIGSQSRTPQRDATPAVWRAMAGGTMLGWVIVDEVVGKHEFITYATAISPRGAVLGVEIMSYRETKGGEVRNANWRAQFDGKTAADNIRLGRAISNISGATLSCRNITDGVRRLLVLHQTVLSALA